MDPGSISQQAELLSPSLDEREGTIRDERDGPSLVRLPLRTDLHPHRASSQGGLVDPIPNLQLQHEAKVTDRHMMLDEERRHRVVTSDEDKRYPMPLREEQTTKGTEREQTLARTQTGKGRKALRHEVSGIDQGGDASIACRIRTPSRPEAFVDLIRCTTAVGMHHVDDGEIPRSELKYMGRRRRSGAHQ